MVIRIEAYQDDDGRIYKYRRDAAKANLIRDFIKMHGTLTSGVNVQTQWLEQLAGILAIDSNGRGREMIREALDRFEQDRGP